VARPLSELWPNGQPPRVMSFLLGAVQLMGAAPVSGGLRMAWSESRQLRVALDHNLL
jgi:hypothetical protein